MRKLLPLAAVLFFVGCGQAAKSPKNGVLRSTCPPPAYAGCSVAKKPTLAPPTGAKTFPDISEFQGCPAFTGPVIFKIYEGGFRQDHSARCNAERVHRLGSWAGVYTFLRPRDCAGQARTTVALLRGLGDVPGPVVADAEVPLPAGCVSAFIGTVIQLRGYPVDVYTSPGTWPGGSFSAHLWVATYGPRPGCVVGICAHVAWQFSDRARCGGIGPGDCSVDSGILSQTVDHTSIAQLRAQVRHLRTKLKTHGCARRRHHHEPLGPKCQGWFDAGDRVHAHITRLGG